MPGSIFMNYDYLLGPEYPVSSWVLSYGLVMAKVDGEVGLLVEYLPMGSGGKAGKRAVCLYPGAGEALYREMDAAPSKGKFVHAKLMKLTYKEI
jgi:hypothetical protein